MKKIRRSIKKLIFKLYQLRMILRKNEKNMIIFILKMNQMNINKKHIKLILNLLVNIVMIILGLQNMGL